jgi:hypothetical protein
MVMALNRNISQEKATLSLSCVLPGLVPQAKGLAVHRHPHHQLGLVRPLLHPVVHREVGVEVGEVVLGMRAEGRHVAGLLVPVSVVVVRHHVDDVQVLVQRGHVISCKRIGSRDEYFFKGL